jgi:ribosomal protein S27AE
VEEAEEHASVKGDAESMKEKSEEKEVEEESVKVSERSEYKARKPHRKMNPRFNIINDKLVKNRPYCRRCGTGVMMAEMVGFYVCGKCGLRENKSLYARVKE